MLDSQIKIIKTPNFCSVHYCKIKSKRFLVFKTNLQKDFYFLIPSNFITFKILNNQFVLTLSALDKKSFSEFNQFYNALLVFNKNIKILYKKQLRLKGLGFRAAISEDKASLNLKLGFSHLCVLPISLETLTVSITKKYITVSGVDKAEVGNFVNKIKSLKIPDKYKGKGFWYKYEKEELKEIKKK